MQVLEGFDFVDKQTAEGHPVRIGYMAGVYRANGLIGRAGVGDFTVEAARRYVGILPKGEILVVIPRFHDTLVRETDLRVRKTRVNLSSFAVWVITPEGIYKVRQAHEQPQRWERSTMPKVYRLGDHGIFPYMEPEELEPLVRDRDWVELTG